MSKTTLENLLEMLERSNSKKKTTEKATEKATENAAEKTEGKTEESQTLSSEQSSPLTLYAVNDKLEGFGQQIGALLASVQKLHEKVDVLGTHTHTHASDAEQPAPDDHTVRYETDDTEAECADADDQGEDACKQGVCRCGRSL